MKLYNARYSVDYGKTYEYYYTIATESIVETITAEQRWRTSPTDEWKIDLEYLMVYNNSGKSIIFEEV